MNQFKWHSICALLSAFQTQTNELIIFYHVWVQISSLLFFHIFQYVKANKI
jgi:hypothetical protein